MNELPKSYEPQTLELRWAAKWSNEPFRADATSGKPPYTIVMPPPNVTGSMHLGTALVNTIIDTLIRYKRMAGFEALYLPGTDHAGIATQVLVERDLKKEGLTRHDLGREKFLERVWQWKERSGGEIMGQLKRLGASADYTRERFTLDAGVSRAVRHQFVKLYHEGLAYRGERIVNWDVVAQTTVSDLEIDRKEQKSQMHTLSYKLEDALSAASNGEAGEIRIATQRPETIFADVAIAVHPEDSRFRHLVGQKARIPLTDRYIPIIEDEAVEMDFGVGALKITPAHDPTDWEIGARHSLEHPSVIDLSGNLSNPELTPAQFVGLERFAGRKAVVRALEESGDLVETLDYKVALGISSRTGSVVEPIVSTQWFVHMKPLADRVLEGLDKGDMTLYPERHLKINIDWLENIRDWNISRQLWWGHQIPAWFDDEGNIFVPPLENPDADPVHPEGKPLHRDPDVFDTWFSSNLWPFSTLEWPNTASEDYRKFYPTALMVTGYDILFFWVARMQMMGYHFTGKAPFKQILLHGLYLDAKGQKMSRSKGNGLDPLELIDTYGADASRFALAYLATGGQDIRHDPRRFEQGRNFANKLWNAARFVMMNLSEAQEQTSNVERLGEAVNSVTTSSASQPTLSLSNPVLDKAALSWPNFSTSRAGPPIGPVRPTLTLADRWILARFNETVKVVTTQLEALDLGAAIRTAYTFAWDEFCDWYIEASKPALKSGNSSTRETILSVLEGILKLLHPVMPFITSEIYESLGHKRQIAVHSWPKYDPALEDAQATHAFDILRDAVNAARSLKSELGVSPQEKVSVALEGENTALVRENAYVVEGIARVNLVQSLEGRTLSFVTPSVTLKAALEGTVDVQEWLGRSRKKLSELEKQIAQAQGKLSNEGFVKNAPEDVLEEERRRVADFTAQKERLEGVLAQFE